MILKIEALNALCSGTLPFGMEGSFQKDNSEADISGSRGVRLPRLAWQDRLLISRAPSCS